MRNAVVVISPRDGRWMTHCVGHAWTQSDYKSVNEVGNFANECRSNSLKATNASNRSYFNSDLITAQQLNKLVQIYLHLHIHMHITHGLKSLWSTLMSTFYYA